MHKVKAVGKFFADFSFTLYVLHVPLIGIIVHASGYLTRHRLSAHDPAHLGAYFVMLSAIVAASYVFHLPFEANTHRLRNRLKKLLPNRGDRLLPAKEMVRRAEGEAKRQ